MKKKTAITIAVIVMVFVCLTVVFSWVQKSVLSSDSLYDTTYIDSGYEITKADYDITVSQNQSARVVETLTVTFFQPSAGIARWLPTNSGEQYTDISVEGDIYYLESESSFIVIYTGEDFGKKYGRGDSITYKISYTVVPPSRMLSNTNYYMNVVPFGWDTYQKDVTLTVSFPYQIKDTIVYMGEYGVTGKTTDYKLLNGNKTISLYSAQLRPYNGITVDVELGRKFDVSFSVAGLLSVLGIIVMLVIGGVIKTVIIKDRDVFPIITFEPPHDESDTTDTVLDPVEMGYLIDGVCESKDVTSMIFYFASKGLIRLEGGDDNEFTLIKTGKIGADAPKHQKIIFSALFRTGNEVTSSQISETMYVDVKKVESEIQDKYEGKLYEKAPSSVAFAVAGITAVLMTIIMSFIATQINASLLSDVTLGAAIVSFLAVALGFLLGKRVLNAKHKHSQSKNTRTLILSTVAIMAIALIASFFLFGGVLPYYGRAFLIAGCATVGLIAGLIGRKSEYYVGLMNKITGFKQFLETAEKDKLETLLADNPEYYYDVLPYANVLGVSDIWADKFEVLKVEPPRYYHGTDVFTFILFNQMIRHTMRMYAAAMITNAIKNDGFRGGGFSGGGGFGGFGGGFGGGGFGGGGGGRR